MFRIRSMCDYRRHVSYIIIKDTRGSLIMYFNYTLFKYVYANIFFIAQVWFWGRGQLVFWGASKFLGASKFSNLLAPRVTASTSLMSRPAVHSSLSRDCSDTLVSGSLKATLVQAEMPLHLRFWIIMSRVPALCLHYYPKVGKVRYKLNFPPFIVQNVTFSQWAPSPEFNWFCFSHIDC